VRVLVTGGAGFIGSAVVRALAEQGYDVRVLDLSTLDSVPAGVEAVRGDVRDRALVEAALTGVDVVSHQAAKVGLGVDLDDMPDYASVNDVGTGVLLAAMARTGVRRLVLASSMVVYGEGRYRCPEHGDVEAPPRSVGDLTAGRFDPVCPHCGLDLAPLLVAESAVPDPRNAYAVSKLTQELSSRVWARECDGSVTALRYHNVYGPGMPRNTPYAGVAAIFRSALELGEAPQVFEDGAQRRDFVHVDDVARANVAALTATATGGRAAVYNVGSGEQRTIGELAEVLSEIMDGPQPVVTGGFRLGDVRHVTADTASIRAELGWRPRVRFRDGVAELVRVPQSLS
jgi:dTDP-L-rhamnose 4-epimerase